jgi:hypothetical protein
MSRRLLPLLLLVLAALALGACGNKQARTLHGETEGTYLDVGPLKYQVQISRLLNPTDREDRSYLVGLAPGQALGRREAWFAVFMRAQNESKDPQQLAESYVVKDSQGNEFRPVPLGADNVFALRPRAVPGKEVYPLLNTPAAESTIQGALVLFRIPYRNLENRPLDLEVSSSAVPGQVGSVALDV